jgi:hypothetical protein
MKITGNNPGNTTPSELIEHVAQIIKEREAKQIPTFYTIKIEQYGKLTPVAEREQGADNFKTQMLKFTSDYKASALVVELFHGKSAKVKNPFQTFNVYLTKQNVPVYLGNTDLEVQNDNSVQQIDSGIPAHRHFEEKMDLQLRFLNSEMDKRLLTERLNNIVERYEEKLKDQERRAEEKMKSLEDKTAEQQQLINDFEQEIGKYEKQKHNSFGNLALGSIGSHLVENLLKSRAGAGLLKGFLGDAGYETMQTHLNGINEEPKQLPAVSNDRVVSEPEPNDPRSVALRYIMQVAQAQADLGLRMIYDICEVSAANPQDLEALWRFAQEIKQARANAAQRGQQTPTPDQRQPDNGQGNDPEDGHDPEGDPEADDPDIDDPNID